MNNFINDTELSLTCFNIFRVDRWSNLYNRGGGILLAIKNTFDYKLSNHISIIPNIDQVFVLLNYNNINLLLACVYIPPNAHLDIYRKHCEIVENLVINYSIDNILILGDFNLNEFSSSYYSSFANTSSNCIVNSYINYLNL